MPYPQFSSADRMAVQGEGMSQMGGFGRRRVMAFAAVVLALCVVAPELAAPIGAATPTTTGTVASRDAAASCISDNRLRKDENAHDLVRPSEARALGTEVPLLPRRSSSFTSGS